MPERAAGVLAAGGRELPFDPVGAVVSAACGATADPSDEWPARPRRPEGGGVASPSSGAVDAVLPFDPPAVVAVVGAVAVVGGVVVEVVVGAVEVVVGRAYVVVVVGPVVAVVPVGAVEVVAVEGG